MRKKERLELERFYVCAVISLLWLYHQFKIATILVQFVKMKESNFPLLSIIIPTLNGEEFISAALESILDQKFDDCEVIFVDGNFSDKTLNIVKNYTAKHPFIKIVSEKLSSQSEAINKGLKLAKGKYVGILNDDHYYSQGTFHEAIQILEQSTGPSVILGNCCFYDRNGRLLEIQKPAYVGLEYFIFGAQRHLMNSSQYFYHRDVHKVIGYFPEGEHLTMELWFYLEVCSTLDIKVAYIDKNWGNFRNYLGTKTFDNSHSHSSIQRQYRARYFKRLKLLPSLRAMSRRAIQSGKFKKIYALVRYARRTYGIFHWRRIVKRKIEAEPVQISETDGELVVLICGFQQLRYGNIPLLVKSALKCSFVSSIIVSNNKAGLDIEKWFDFTHPKLKIINQPVNRNCAFRIEMLSQVPGKYFAVIDDDVCLLPSQIKMLFDALKKMPESVHGFAGEIHPHSFQRSEMRKWKYNETCELENVCRAYFFASPLVERFNQLNAKLETYHDDILLSSVGQCPPQAHHIGEVLNCITYDMENVAVSSGKSFFQERNELIKTLIQMGIGHFSK